MRRSPGFAVVWLLLALIATSASAALTCACCKQSIRGEFVWVSHPSLAERQSVCLDCGKLDTTCFICRLPVGKDFAKLEDGRLLCLVHAADAVLSQHELERVFEEARRETGRLLAPWGTVTDRNVTVHMVSLHQMERLAEDHLPDTNRLSAMGLTWTQRTNSEVSHTIYLLGGLNRARTLAVAAHEYAHAWLNENLPRGRNIEKDTVEAFCELVAYRVMTGFNEELEKKVILANSYTRGETQALLKTEDDHSLHRLVEWLKSGEGNRLESADTVLALKKEDVSSKSVWVKTPPTTVPDKLLLRGLSGRSGRWLALINNESLLEGETARVRVGTSNILLRCLSVDHKSAVIEIVGTGERQQLYLRPP